MGITTDNRKIQFEVLLKIETADSPFGVARCFDKEEIVIKNIFGICFVKGQEEGVIDGTPFATACVSEQQERLMQESADEIDSLQKKGSLPIGLQIVKMLVGTGIFLCALNFVFRLLEVGFQQTIDELWIILLIALFLLLLYLPLMFVQRKRSREVAETVENTLLLERTESLYQASRQQLGIPDDAQEVDIISTVYRIKNGREKILYTQNFSASVYHKSECLCFADTTQVYSIPLSSIRESVMVKKQITLPNWNKEDAYNSKKYKPYRIRENNIGQYFIRHYLSIRIAEERGEFEIMIPEYDVPVIEPLLPHPVVS